MLGGYQPGEYWNFCPISINQQNINNGEKSSDKSDIWFQANSKLCQTFCNLVEDKISREEAIKSGLSDLYQASLIESGLENLIAN